MISPLLKSLLASAAEKRLDGAVGAADDAGDLSGGQVIGPVEGENLHLGVGQQEGQLVDHALRVDAGSGIRCQVTLWTILSLW